MGSQTLEIIRQGVWASLTGGWFYDPHQDLFCNTFHLYLWLFLFCLPFSIYLCFPPTLWIWSVYCSTIATAFIIIKVVNSRLHSMFDNSECIEESSRTLSSTHDSDVSSSKLDEHISKSDLKSSFRELDNVAIEMKELNNCDKSNREENDNTPPVQCSSRNSFTNSLPARRELSTVDSMEYINKLVGQEVEFQSCVGTLDLKVDVHRKNSSGSSDDSPTMKSKMNRFSSPNPIPSDSGKDDGENYGDVQGAQTTSKSTSADDKEMQNESKHVGHSEDSIVSTSSTFLPRGHQYSSYLPNLAQGLLSTSSSNALLKGTGSFELGEFSWGEGNGSPNRIPRRLERKNRRSSVGGTRNNGSGITNDRRRTVRRTKSALETSQHAVAPHPPPSHPVSLDAISNRCPRMTFPGRSTDFFRRSSFSELIKPIAEQSDEHSNEHRVDIISDDCKQDEEHHSETGNFQRVPPLSNSARKSHDSRGRVTFSNQSIDKAYQAVFEKHFPERVNPVVGNFRPDLNPVNSNCDASRFRISSEPSASDADDATPDSESSSIHGTNVADQTNSDASTVIDCLNNGCDDNASIQSNFDLSWLFDDERDNNECEESSTNETVSSILFSCDTSPLASPADNGEFSTREMGAIPKRRLHTTQSTGLSERPAGTVFSDAENTNMSLSQRLLEILKLSTPAECERELLKLKQELEQTANPVPDKQAEGSNQGGPSSHTSPQKRRLASNRRRLPIKTVSSNKSSENCSIEECFSLLPVSSSNTETSQPETSGKKKKQQDPLVVVRDNVIAGPGTHIANSHNDTTDGAIHCFQDEHGNWLTYTFNENSSGVATGLAPVPQSKLLKFVTDASSKWDVNASNTTSSSGSTIILDSPTGGAMQANDASSTSDSPHGSLSVSVRDYNLSTNNNSTNEPDIPQSIISATGQTQRSPLQLFAESLFTRAAAAAAQATGATGTTGIAIPQAASSHGGTGTEFSFCHKLRFNENNQQRKPKLFYKFEILPRVFTKVRFDRLALLALLDRNLGTVENFISIILAILVGVLGALVLSYQFHHDFAIFIFCVVIASCQYSLLKSVQPDAASPTHGYNKFVAFSRPAYFCLCCALIIIFQAVIKSQSVSKSVTLYGFALSSISALIFIRDLLIYFVLFFPLIFSFGLLPQINTFLIYLLEQIDMHVFGGNASTCLIASFLNITKSIIAVGTIYGFAYGALMEAKMSQHVLFSIFCGLLVAISYHLSRCASDPYVLWSLIKSQLWVEEEEKEEKKVEHLDPLPDKLQKTLFKRIKSDVITCVLIAILVFAVHVSTVFTALQPHLRYVLYVIAGVFGLVTHYILPQVRKQLPWLCCSHPILKPNEYEQYEAQDAAKVMWFEKLFVWLNFIERNMIYPVLFLSALTTDSPHIIQHFGAAWGSLVVVICGIKCLRCTYSDNSQHFLIVIFTFLFFHFDYQNWSESFLVDYFFMCILHSKFYDFLLKVRFVITYIAPWQITWGSAFHAFAQPFSVPHSAMLFIQAAISAVLSTPLNPILGSAIFITSYVRPIKFWERDYNTKRVDHSNTRLSSHLERNPGADDNNLNSIFYEHLTRSLQHSLYGDLALGRWGNVSQGDCFVLASDNLNCLVHIIELGNGLVTFQVRGLEFRGTYCQQREVEAISEGIDEDDGCCCCEPGHIPHMLSMNAAFNQRWLAWEVTATKYILEGYSVCDNNATSMLQVFDLRKVLITYYVKSIIYYTVKSTKLEEWLQMESILEALRPTLDKSYADLDPVFNMNIDEDYDFRASGVSRNSFCLVYLDWIQYCVSKREKAIDYSRDSYLVSLCFALSLLGRRALGAASHNLFSSCGYFSVDFLLYGLHALFKGDFRITSVRDEWIFQDMELLKKVVAPGVRMSLKLHQDHFMSPFEYDDPQTLFEAISSHEKNLVISHEGDPAWRNAVLSGVPSLLALRHVFDEGSDEYKIIMLNKRFLSFRVIKLNRECVRGLWSGQQQELVYLRNRNPERGSIQNAKQALRNIINSSCDQPIGYPIYVSPLTTSYLDTSKPLCSIVGGPISLSAIKNFVVNSCRRLRTRCGEGCSSGGTGSPDDIYGHDDNRISMQAIQPNITGLNTSGSQSGESNIGISGSGSIGRGSVTGASFCHSSLSAARGSMMSMVSGSASIIPLGKPSSSTLVSLTGILNGTTSECSSGTTSSTNINLQNTTPVNKSKDTSSIQSGADGGQSSFKPRGGSLKSEAYLFKGAECSPHHPSPRTTVSGLQRYCGELGNYDRKSSRGSDRKIVLIKMDRFNEDDDNKNEDELDSGV